ncbi:hypothetical protein GJAV_G00237840 [Gymnothorax javanicus]|nr:hypothetical protein GJAV_G00237840 [Gymnothorax javanicus]
MKMTENRSHTEVQNSPHRQRIISVWRYSGEGPCLCAAVTSPLVLSTSPATVPVPHPSPRRHLSPRHGDPDPPGPCVLSVP